MPQVMEGKPVLNEFAVSNPGLPAGGLHAGLNAFNGLSFIDNIQKIEHLSLSAHKKVSSGWDCTVGRGKGSDRLFELAIVVFFDSFKNMLFGTLFYLKMMKNVGNTMKRCSFINSWVRGSKTIV